MRRQKSFLLLLLALVLLAGFFALPENYRWGRKLIVYGNDVNRQRRKLSEEDRLVARFRNEYRYSKQVGDFFRHKGLTGDVLVLMPPSSYLKARGIDYHVPEPAVFYYFTGLKTVWANSDSAFSANWWVHAVNGALLPDSIIDQQALRDTILAYRKMGVSL